MPERLANQFKKLQEVGPSAEWTEATRNFLIARIQQDTLTQETPFFSRWKLFFNEGFQKIMPSPVKVISSLVIISLLGGAGLFAQAESNPKHILYAVKRTLEKIELVLAVTPQSETKVNLRHATKRKEEAVKLAQKTNLSAEEKDGLINTVINSLEQNISAAGNSLGMVDEAKNTDQAVELAQEITANINNNLQGLEEVKDIASSDSVNKNVFGVQSAMEGVENSSIEVLIQKLANQEANGQFISEEKVKEIVNNKIERTAEKISAKEQAVKNIDLNKVVIVKEDRIGTTYISIKLDIKKIVSQAVEKLAEAPKLLEEAKSLLAGNLLSESMGKIKEVEAIIKETEEIIAPITGVSEEDALEAADEGDIVGDKTDNSIANPVNNDSASSTPEITPEVMEQILNYAPLGGEITYSASYTENSVDNNQD
ncbi:hypothetical protein KJ840_00400 [Patescibacteria group bacterium]|nr:hypothetical protein [Patescibacteria group bacterium]